jgi:hypothetical protein
MYLSPDGREIELESGEWIAATYTSDPGRLTITQTATTGEAKEITLRIDPWAPEGFRMHEWREASGLMVCGATRLVMLDAAELSLKATVPLEYEECETGDRPWFVETKGVLLVATETRLFCFDERLAIRWCWTTRVYSDEWWTLTAPPIVEGTSIQMHLLSPKRTVLHTISLVDASSV